MTDIKTQKPVGIILRIGVMFYDTILLAAVLFLAAVLVAPTFNITMEHPLYPLFIIYIYLVAFIFFAWFWTHGGQTLGLKTWKLKIVSNNGEGVTWKQALLRYLSSLLCWLSMGIGFLWCYTNKERLAWNDLWSKTHIKRINE